MLNSYLIRLLKNNSCLQKKTKLVLESGYIEAINC